ncbi:MAG: hypothetical protein QM775_15680 [Pirellulales bacterium]
MLLLVQFVYRLAFGMAAAMAVTSPRQVTSGYFRNNLYVLLGMTVLVALAAFAGVVEPALLPKWPAVAAAVLSYVGAACWLYEKSRAGIVVLVAIAVLTLIGALYAVPTTFAESAREPFWQAAAYADAVAAGLLLGVTMAAMLLGHWYLNAPGMPMQPLRRLTLWLGAAVLLRTVVSAVGLWGFWNSGAVLEPAEQIMLALRWLAGMGGTAVLVVMTWTTLKIPNTQAATGMLYVAVITTFLGELVGQLLSAGRLYPL